MKKLLLVVVLLLSLIAIAGCTTEDEKDAFIFELINLQGDLLLSETIPFDSNATTDLIELIDEVIELDYTVFEFGTFINGIGGNYPTEYGITYNYYYSLYVNGVSSMVGLDQIHVVNGTKISFIEVTVLDETDLLVDELIMKFIEEYADTYLTSTLMDHHVAAAIAQLHSKGYDVPALSNWVPDPSTLFSVSTISNAMKTAILETVYSRTISTTKTALEAFVPQNHYEAISVLTGLSLVQTETTRIQSLIQQITATNPTYMDSDYVGMALMALSPYHDLAAVISAKTSYLSYIVNNITETGVSAWGNPNASSTASVILGLVAHGINPRHETYQKNDVDLIEALLLYADEGAFKWTLDSETLDLQFSTPQAFAALVAYKIYRDVYGNPPFNLFDLA